MGKLLNELKEYFKNTSEEQIKKDWEEVKKNTEGVNGPTMEEFLEEQKFWQENEKQIRELDEHDTNGKRGFITIDYDESNQDSYKSVELHIGDTYKKRFETGNFIIDWINVMQFVQELMYHGRMPGCSFSSSVDHFYMDGDKYITKDLYMDSTTQEFYLYSDREVRESLLLQAKVARCVKYFEVAIPSEHSDWTHKDLQKYYKNNK